MSAVAESEAALVALRLLAADLRALAAGDEA